MNRAGEVLNSVYDGENNSLKVNINPDQLKSSENIVQSKIYEENISALRLVTMGVAQDGVMLATRDTLADSTVVGMTTMAGRMGERGNILEFGEYLDAFFVSIARGLPLYLGENGQITETPLQMPMGSDIYSTRVGFSMGNGRIFINIEPPIRIDL